jgi:hypothetical protein
MPKPKRQIIVTVALAHSPAAIDEWKTGIDQFLQWASLARTGETKEPAALAADKALTAFSEGRFKGILYGVAAWAVQACANIRYLVRDAHWHLRRCPNCKRWLLAKDQRKTRCRRVECVRALKTPQRQRQRKDRRDLDRGAVALALRTF